MGALSATITFPGAPPTAVEVVTALCEHTGEVVSYDEQLRELSCASTNDSAGFEASRHLRQHIIDPLSGWYLLNLNLKGGYLWFATLVVLQRLGGTCDWEIPSWAFRPWHLAKREQKRWFVRRFTYDEARRLGVE